MDGRARNVNRSAQLAAARNELPAEVQTTEESRKKPHGNDVVPATPERLRLAALLAPSKTSTPLEYPFTLTQIRAESKDPWDRHSAMRLACKRKRNSWRGCVPEGNSCDASFLPVCPPVFSRPRLRKRRVHCFSVLISPASLAEGLQHRPHERRELSFLWPCIRSTGRRLLVTCRVFPSVFQPHPIQNATRLDARTRPPFRALRCFQASEPRGASGADHPSTEFSLFIIEN